MTVPVAFVLGLMAGSAVAWIARGPLSDESQPLRTRYGFVALVFGAAALMPAGVFLFALEPAWALMYLAHPSHVGPAVWLAVAGALGAAPMLGLRISHGLLADRTVGRWWIWMGAVGGLFLFGLVAGVERIGTVAYYEGYHYGGGGVPLTVSAVFWPVLVTSLVLPVLAAYSLLQVQRHVALSEDVPLIDSDDIPFEADSPAA